MASSSGKSSDEEPQKAQADLDELIARNPIPDEFKFLGPEHEAYVRKREEKKKKGNTTTKKKKLYKLPPDQVQILLNLEFEEEPVRECKALAALEEAEGKEKYEDVRTMLRVSEVFKRHLDKRMRAYLEKIRHEFLTKGCVMYKATDDEDEEGGDVPALAVVPQGAQGSGRGRRRHRPGVTKSAGGVVKKLN